MNRLAVVIAFALGAGLAWTLATRSAPRPAAGPVDPGAGRQATPWDELLAALTRIEARLDVPPPAPQPAPDAEADVEEPARAVLAALDELRAELARAGTLAPRPWWDGFAETETAFHGGYDLLPLKEQQPEPNWTNLRELIALWNRDEPSARQSTLLLGYRDVLERFGTPTEVWAGEKGLNWSYVDGLDPFTGEAQLEVWLQFHDGFATELGIKQP